MRALFPRGRLPPRALAPSTSSPPPGTPVVIGEWRGAEGAPTLLVYGHYDVQPPKALDEWLSPAGGPTVIASWCWRIRRAQAWRTVVREQPFLQSDEVDVRELISPMPDSRP